MFILLSLLSISCENGPKCKCEIPEIHEQTNITNRDETSNVENFIARNKNKINSIFDNSHIRNESEIEYLNKNLENSAMTYLSESDFSGDERIAHLYLMRIGYCGQIQALCSKEKEYLYLLENFKLYTQEYLQKGIENNDYPLVTADLIESLQNKKKDLKNELNRIIDISPMPEEYIDLTISIEDIDNDIQFLNTILEIHQDSALSDEDFKARIFPIKEKWF